MIEQVKKALANIPSFNRVVVGISGGADSVALAHILHTLGYSVILVHVNYGIRGDDSMADEKFVIDLANKWEVPITVHRAARITQGNFENQARTIRYDFFESVRKSKNAKYIAVGHHQNDQLETILMHIERGAGLRGRCGMYLCKNNIIRPLLEVGKESIIQYLKDHQLTHRTDSTNTDLSFKRNFIRHKVIPKLREKWSDFDQKILKWSQISKRRLEKNEKCAQKWIQHHVKNNRFDRLAFLDLLSGVQSEVLFQLINKKDVYKPAIDELIQLIKEGKTSKKKTIKNTCFRIEYGEVCIELSDYIQLTNEEVKLINNTIKWGDWTIDYQGSQPIHIRHWKKGDRFQPIGMKGSKKLQDFFVDAKIPKLERHQIPIITNKNGDVLSVGNLRFSKKGASFKSLLKINRR